MDSTVCLSALALTVNSTLLEKLLYCILWHCGVAGWLKTFLVHFGTSSFTSHLCLLNLGKGLTSKLFVMPQIMFVGPIDVKKKNQTPGAKMTPIQSNMNCSPGAYTKKFSSFQV